MNRIRLTSLVASSVFFLALGQDAQAQVPGPLAPGRPPAQAGPTFSPYLNLLRGGTNPVLNYYGLVRPELQWRSSVRQLSQEIQDTQGEIAAGQPGAALQTGHPVQFLNLTHYFPASAQGAPGRGSPGRSSVAPAYPTGAPAGGAARPARGR